MWVDTHCHLDAAEFDGEQEAIAASAAARGVGMIVIPAVARANFPTVANLSHRCPNASYALGIHPICVPAADEADLAALRASIPDALVDPRFVAIGEIGLDFFIPALCTPEMRAKQEHFFVEQLKIARDYDLPVLLHVRRSQDIILKYLRRIGVGKGIAHAFNGSEQQAGHFIDLGMKLGLGGAMTFTRALQIRRLAAWAPAESIVLETDAPDIAPSWVHPGRNSPEQLPQIGALLAELRGMGVEQVAAQTSVNALAALPRLSALMNPIGTRLL